MTDLVTRMRCQAEDLHVLNPSSETVKCLSLGADEITQLRTDLAEQCRLLGMGSEREAKTYTGLSRQQERAMDIQENGPWVVSEWSNGRIAIQSDDFHFDAALEVSGDFGSPEVKRAYAEEICRRLNTTNPTVSR